jgi:hypothetical protein
MYYNYFKEYLLPWRITKINKHPGLFFRMVCRLDPVALLAEMDGMVADKSSYVSLSIPKSVYVCPVIFYHGRLKDLQQWWERYPPKLTQEDITSYISLHLDKLITASRSAKRFEWMLSYFEDRFEPYDTQVKLSGG